MTEHPCLCDICLKARDEEIRRVRKATVEEIEMVERRLTIISNDKSFYGGWEYEFSNTLQEQWYEVMKLLSQLTNSSKEEKK